MKLTESVSSISPAQTRAVSSSDSRSAKNVQDKVSVSDSKVSAAADRGAVEAARSAVASSRADRVQEIVNAVRSGQYYPSPQQIAQKLVSEAEVEARLRAMLAK